MEMGFKIVSVEKFTVTAPYDMRKVYYGWKEFYFGNGVTGLVPLSIYSEFEDQWFGLLTAAKLMNYEMKKQWSLIQFCNWNDYNVIEIKILVIDVGWNKVLDSVKVYWRDKDYNLIVDCGNSLMKMVEEVKKLLR